MADEEDGKRIKLCLLSSDFHFVLGLINDLGPILLPDLHSHE